MYLPECIHSTNGFLAMSQVAFQEPRTQDHCARGAPIQSRGEKMNKIQKQKQCFKSVKVEKAFRDGERMEAAEDWLTSWAWRTCLTGYLKWNWTDEKVLAKTVPGRENSLCKGPVVRIVSWLRTREAGWLDHIDSEGNEASKGRPRAGSRGATLT